MIKYFTIGQVLILQIVSDFPCLVSIRNGIEETTHMCSGTLIQVSWVLTAAHCVKLHIKNSSNIHIFAGEPRSEEEQNRTAQEIYYHKNFQHDQHLSDIALISTEKPFQKKASVDVCPIPNHSMPEEIRRSCERVWLLSIEFQASKANRSSTVVMISEHTVMWNRECEKMRKHTLTKHTFCGTSKSIAACSLDTGGPAICRNKIYGVIYFGCPHDEFPSYFTRVDRYLNFIQDVMKIDIYSPMKRSQGYRKTSDMSTSLITLLIVLGENNWIKNIVFKLVSFSCRYLGTIFTPTKDHET